MLEGLKAQFPKEYMDDYGLSHNPLDVVVPCFPGKNFFGSCVLNLVSITNGCDGVNSGEMIDHFKTVYDRFILYETHIWVSADTFAGDSTSTEAVLANICNQLVDFGFTYHGKINTQAEGQLVIELHTAFKGRVHDRFGN